MLLFKKFCRAKVNQRNRSNRNSSDDQRQSWQQSTVVEPSSNVNDFIPLQVGNSDARGSNNRNNINEHGISRRRQGCLEPRDSQFVDIAFRRTPPPVYDHDCVVPATPPPSYTRQSNNQVVRSGNFNSNISSNSSSSNNNNNSSSNGGDDDGNCDGSNINNEAAIGELISEVPEVLSVVRHVNASSSIASATVTTAAAVHLNAIESLHGADNVSNRLQRQLPLIRNEQTQPQTQSQIQIQSQPQPQSQLQLQPQQQRVQHSQQQSRNQNQRRLQRQRLHRLQQQQRRFIDTNASSSDSSTSASGADCSELEFRGQQNSRQRQQQQHSHRLPQLFRDAYCPDLLHSCSLILEHQQRDQSESTDSSVASFTDTSPSNSIDKIEICRNRERRSVREFANSTPNLREIPNDCVDSSSYLNEKHKNQRHKQQVMGQNLSLRRPRFSLTWILREQQQQQQQQQEEEQEQANEKDEKKPNQLNQQEEILKTNITSQNESALETILQTEVESCNNNNAYHSTTVNDANNTDAAKTFQMEKPESVNLSQVYYTAPKKRYRLKQLPSTTEALNGYATTPTGCIPTTMVSSIGGSQKFFSNQNLPEYKEKRYGPSKELFFVCTPQRLPKSYQKTETNETVVHAKKRSELHRRFAAKMALIQQSSQNRSAADGADLTSNVANCSVRETQIAAVAHETMPINRHFEKEDLKSLKCPSYSEPSLIAASEGNPRRHRHRKRRDRIRGTQKFGYEISNVDEFLTKCSLTAPANIPVVLSTSSTLYQTRPDGYQAEIALPLGMVVNAVFKNQNWLYVQTPHAEEGYVGYTCCLPLGILPPPPTRGSKPTPCWESNVDVFPRPCGNMTDSEKEIRLRGGTRSDGARTPCGKRNGQSSTVINSEPKDVDVVNGNSFIAKIKPDTDTTTATATMTEAKTVPQARYEEQQVDRLYLRVASQPKLVEKAYAQLRSIKNSSGRIRTTTTMTNTTTVTGTLTGTGTATSDEYVTLHSQLKLKQQQKQFYDKQAYGLSNNRPAYVTNGQNGQHLHPANNAHPQINTTTQHHIRKQQNNQQHSLRETLAAINMDYITESIKLYKGEIVTLCESRETKDQRQWFYVKARDGREGYIPAEVAGHGFF